MSSVGWSLSRFCVVTVVTWRGLKWINKELTHIKCLCNTMWNLIVFHLFLLFSNHLQILGDYWCTDWCYVRIVEERKTECSKLAKKGKTSGWNISLGTMDFWKMPLMDEQLEKDQEGKRIMMLDSIKEREPYQRTHERAEDRQGWSDHQIWNLLNSSTHQRVVTWPLYATRSVTSPDSEKLAPLELQDSLTWEILPYHMISKVYIFWKEISWGIQKWP